MLVRASFFAAALNPVEVIPVPDAPGSLFGYGMREVMLVLGVAVILGLVLFLGVYFSYKNRRHHSSGQHLSRPIYRAEKGAAKPDSRKVRIKRKRRDHPDNLPRNPTLGETGGLPPIRPEDEPPAERAQAS